MGGNEGGSDLAAPSSMAAPLPDDPPPLYVTYRRICRNETHTRDRRVHAFTLAARCEGHRKRARARAPARTHAARKVAVARSAIGGNSNPRLYESRGPVQIPMRV